MDKIVIFTAVSTCLFLYLLTLMLLTLWRRDVRLIQRVNDAGIVFTK